MTTDLPVLFVATRCAAEAIDEHDTFVVVLAESDEPSAERLEFQIGFEFDEQDRALGQDTYCVCRATGETHYGGVVEWNLSEENLDVRLSAEAARVLELPRALRIVLAAGPAVHAGIAEGLRRVLG